MIKAVAFYVLFIPIVFPASSQSGKADQDKDAFRNWINDNISVRRAFDGSRQESLPAALHFMLDFEERKNNSFNVDAGIKLIEIQPFRNAELVMYPSVEWHKQLRNGDPKDPRSFNNWSANINMEFAVFDVRKYLISPTFIGSTTYKNNIKEETEEFKTSLLATFFSNREWLPGAWIRKDGAIPRFRYYPYAGYEHFSPLNTDSSDGLSYFLIRFSSEYYPVATIERQIIQVTFNYVHRFKINDIEALSSPFIINAGVNWYLTRKENLALSINYVNGRSPSSDYIYNHQLTFGLSYSMN